jgi:hypothetical protein
MKRIYSLVAYLGCFASLHAELINLSKEDSYKIGEKIWYNESKNSIEGLTHWNKGENFPSLGIGHFIWYPEGVKERFEETFPQLLIFLKKQGVVIPDFLKDTKGSLWKNRDEFLKQFDSLESKVLRRFLYETRDEQMKFILHKLHEVLPLMIDHVSSDAKIILKDNFHALLRDARGVYALVDYFNFKGAGLSELESYQGQGWGLKQVLEKMDCSNKDPVFAFAEAAKRLLKQRVENSPKERGEARWLQGWLNRVNTYLQN